MPSDYDDEDDESENNSESEIQTSHKKNEQKDDGKSSSLRGSSSDGLKSTSKNQNDEYPFNEINRIINEAKQNNQFLDYLNDQNDKSQISDSEISDNSSALSDKYF
jgi:hypothetical protein